MIRTRKQIVVSLALFVLAFGVCLVFLVINSANQFQSAKRQQPPAVNRKVVKYKEITAAAEINTNPEDGLPKRLTYKTEIETSAKARINEFGNLDVENENYDLTVYPWLTNEPLPVTVKKRDLPLFTDVNYRNPPIFRIQHPADEKTFYYLSWINHDRECRTPTGAQASTCTHGIIRMYKGAMIVRCKIKAIGAEILCNRAVGALKLTIQEL